MIPKIKRRIHKKGFQADIMDIVIGLIFFVLLTFLIFTYNGARRSNAEFTIGVEATQVGSSRDLLVLLRTPFEDSTIGKTIIEKYLDGSLQEESIRTPLGQEIYRFFNRYYHSNSIPWQLDVNEKYQSGGINNYMTFNEQVNHESIVQGFGTGPCGGISNIEVTTFAQADLPLKKREVVGLEVRFKRCTNEVSD